jgi:hypothetical protein
MDNFGILENLSMQRAHLRYCLICWQIIETDSALINVINVFFNFLPSRKILLGTLYIVPNRFRHRELYWYPVSQILGDLISTQLHLGQDYQILVFLFIHTIVIVLRLHLIYTYCLTDGKGRREEVKEKESRDTEK